MKTKAKSVRAAAILLVVAILAACAERQPAAAPKGTTGSPTSQPITTGQTTEPLATTQPRQPVNAVTTAQAGEPGPASAGALLFTANCAVCHGSQGGGGLGPALAGDQNLQNADYVIGKVLLGGGGMPPFSTRLTAPEIANVASFVRTSWGNSFGAVDAATVEVQWSGLRVGPTLVAAPAAGEGAAGAAQSGSQAGQNQPGGGQGPQGTQGAQASQGAQGGQDAQGGQGASTSQGQQAGAQAAPQGQTQQGQSQQGQSQQATSQQGQSQQAGSQQGQSQQGGSQEAQQSQAQGQPQQSGAQQGQQNTADGAEIYTQAGCSSCHGQNGEGGAGPALAGNQNLQGAQHVINQILNGGGGMPAFSNQLTSEQIAAVATHERTSWGNSYGQVTADQVSEARGGGQNADQGNGQGTNQTGEQGGQGQGDSAASPPSQQGDQAQGAQGQNRQGGNQQDADQQGTTQQDANQPSANQQGAIQQDAGAQQNQQGQQDQQDQQSRQNQQAQQGQQNQPGQPDSNQSGGQARTSTQAQDSAPAQASANQRPAQPQAGGQVPGSSQGAEVETAGNTERLGQLQLSAEPDDVRVTVIGPDRFVYMTVLSGTEKLTDLAPGTYLTTATKAGYATASQEVDVTAGGAAIASLKLEQENGSGGAGQQ